MNSVSLIRLFDLIKTGIYSGCAAIITDEAPTAHMMNQLSEKSLQHFRSVNVWNLSNELTKHALQGDIEILLVYGLEHCLPDSAAMHSARTYLDIRRNSGMFSMMFLDQSTYNKHFCDSNQPFYLFCDSIDQKSISDWI
ncbi:MAG: hypothetical protein CMH97_10640 [Oceanospirillaceae bacterium]|nr:hypothetical protein [Oceanospirillaceae bacterium]|tara:strand:- start:693 stop:1109 length:417 start_codon:yes stop_codon:yes gene_type:complete